MSVGDWVGVVSLILAVPLGVSSIFVYHRLVGVLERRRLIKTHETRRQALRLYNRIRAFREGRKDKYAFYILCGSLAVISAVTASLITVILLIVEISLETKATYALVAITCALLAALFLLGIYSTARPQVPIEVGAPT